LNQQTAELLTEEGHLLQGIQVNGCNDYDIDEYATKLEVILEKRMESIQLLQEKLTSFKKKLE